MATMPPDKKAFLAHLVKQLMEPQDVPLVSMGQGGGESKLPFFCVSAPRELVPLLDQNQPFYHVGMHFSKEPSVKPLAGRIVDSILDLGLKGPYVIGGVCMGGLIAYEVAQQLEARKRQVPLLVIFNMPPPGRPLRTLPKLGYHLQVLRNLPAGERQKYLCQKAVAVKRELILATTRWYRRFRSGPCKEVDVGSSLLSDRENYFEFCKHLIRSYLPEQFPGRIALFLFKPLINRIDYTSWSGLACGGLECQEIAGDHVSWMREPNISATAKHLMRCLDRAAAECSLGGGSD